VEPLYKILCQRSNGHSSSDCAVNGGAVIVAVLDDGGRVTIVRELTTIRPYSLALRALYLHRTQDDDRTKQEQYRKAMVIMWTK
jgi:hypothetical protein